MATVEELVVRIEADTRLLRRQLRDAGVQVNRFGKRGARGMKTVDRATQGLTRQFSNLKSAIAGVTIGALTIGFVRTADAAGLAASRLKLVTDSAEELSSVQDGLFRSAQDTGTEYEALIEVYSRVARGTENLNLGTETQIRLTDLLAKGVAVEGREAATAAAGLRQLGQALQSGRLQGDELVSVSENLTFVLDALEKQTGMTRAELRKMAEAGQLTSELIVTSLLGMADEIEANYAKVSDTVGKALTRIQNSLFQAVGATEDATGATARLAESLNSVAEVIESPGFQASMDGFVGFLSDVARETAEGVEELGNWSLLLQGVSKQLHLFLRQQGLARDFFNDRNAFRGPVPIPPDPAFSGGIPPDPPGFRGLLEVTVGQGIPLPRRRPAEFAGRGGGVASLANEALRRQLERTRDELADLREEYSLAEEASGAFAFRQAEAATGAEQATRAINTLGTGALSSLNRALSSNADSWTDWAIVALSALEDVLRSMQSFSGGSGGGGGFGDILGLFSGGGAAPSGPGPGAGPPIRRQFGGGVGAGQMALVGEAGPELITPSVNSMVIPNSRLSGGTGGVVVQQSFDFRGTDRSAVGPLLAASSQIAQAAKAAVFEDINRLGPAAQISGRRRRR